LAVIAFCFVEMTTNANKTKFVTQIAVKLDVVLTINVLIITCAQETNVSIPVKEVLPVVRMQCAMLSITESAAAVPKTLWADRLLMSVV
jgi:hypothetical protein